MPPGPPVPPWKIVEPPPPETVAAVNAFFTDDALLAWGTHIGLDLTDNDRLLDALAVGLTVALWRHSELTDAHQGAYAPIPPSLDVLEADAWHTRETRATNAMAESGSARDDARRTHRVARRTAQGFAIPNDVMFRSNVATTKRVRATLAADWDSQFAAPGATPELDIAQPLGAVMLLLQDPTRSIIIGSTTIAAGQLLPPSHWAEIADHVEARSQLIDRAATLAGPRQALWWVALSGASYAYHWFAAPGWIPSVDLLRKRTLANPDLRPGLPLSAQGKHTKAFFARLRSSPETLTAHEADWVIHTRMDEALPPLPEPSDLARPGIDPANWFF